MATRMLKVPKELSREGDLVLISRKEYESLVRLKQTRQVRLTPAQKKALITAERNLQKGRTLS